MKSNKNTIDVDQLQQLHRYRNILIENQRDLAQKMEPILVNISELKQKDKQPPQIQSFIKEKEQLVGQLEEQLKNQIQLIFALNAIIDGKSISHQHQSLLNADPIMGKDEYIRNYSSNFSQQQEDEVGSVVDESRPIEKQSTHAEIKHYSSSQSRTRSEGFFEHEFEDEKQDEEKNPKDKAKSSQRWQDKPHK